jgi:hypothetical protein
MYTHFYDVKIGEKFSCYVHNIPNMRNVTFLEFEKISEACGKNSEFGEFKFSAYCLVSVKA